MLIMNVLLHELSELIMTLLEPPSESMEVTGEIEQDEVPHEEIEEQVEEEMEEEVAEEEGISHLVCVSPLHYSVLLKHTVLYYNLPLFQYYANTV